MKNFKKYLVLALCFGLSLSSLNASQQRQLNQFIKMGKDATTQAEKNSALREALRLVDGVRKFYINNGQPQLFGKIDFNFQDAFGTSIASAEARERREGPEAELEEAAELIDEAQRRATQEEKRRREVERNIRDVQGNLDTTEAGRQALELQLDAERREKQRHQREVATINAEARKTKLDLLRLQGQMAERQTAERQAQENQNVASSSTDNLSADFRAENNTLKNALEGLQAEQAQTLQQLQACQAKNAELLNTVQDAREETARLNDEKGDLEQEIAILKEKINRLGSTTTGNADHSECEEKLQNIQTRLRHMITVNRHLLDLQQKNDQLAKTMSKE